MTVDELIKELEKRPKDSVVKVWSDKTDNYKYAKKLLFDDDEKEVDLV